MTFCTAIKELRKVRKDYPKAWIGYNANTNKLGVYVIPKSFTNSLLIKQY